MFNSTSFMRTNFYLPGSWLVTIFVSSLKTKSFSSICVVGLKCAQVELPAILNSKTISFSLKWEPVHSFIIWGVKKSIIFFLGLCLINTKPCFSAYITKNSFWMPSIFCISMVICLYLDYFWLNFYANFKLSTSLLSPVSELIYQQHSSLTLNTNASSKTRWLHSSLLSLFRTTSFKLRSLNVFFVLSSLFEWAVITFSLRCIWRWSVSPSSSINLNFEMFYF